MREFVCENTKLFIKQRTLFFSPKKDDDGFAPRVLPSGELPEPGEEEEEEEFFFFLGFLFFSFFLMVVLVITRECALCDERECNWMVPILLSFLFLSLSLSRLSFEEKRTDLFLY